MCGIAGLYTKTPELQERLGELLSLMLGQLSDRGPDSAGVAFYRDPVAAGACKVSLHSAAAEPEWEGLRAELADVFGAVSGPSVRATHAVFVVDAEASDAAAWLSEHHPELRLMSAGRVIEIFKEAGRPEEFVRRFALNDISGSHALGHTRMATESRVTTEHSHPFSTGLDLCLVHNGSLSNHNRLRDVLRREGIRFQTDNDSEVAAGYLTWRLREGASLDEALEGCMDDLDGFYTFAVGTADGFAVLRDPIACKPAVMAETDEWVAMASEYRAIAELPGASDATIWEPAPGQVYSWGTATAATAASTVPPTAPPTAAAA
jgi:glutamate synthase domain-containing protein 1